MRVAATIVDDLQDLQNPVTLTLHLEDFLTWSAEGCVSISLTVGKAVIEF